MRLCRPTTAAAVAALLGVLLVSCVSVRSPRVVFDANQTWEQRRAMLQQLDGFELRGRLAARNAEQGVSASIHWLQKGTDSDLSLQGPLGIGGLQIRLRGDNLHLTTARGVEFDGEAARQAMIQSLGFEPPLAQLRYWVLGVPAPQSAGTESLDAAGRRLLSLQQSGWQVQFEADPATTNEVRPKRLTATRGATRVRLLVDRWGR